MYSIFSLESNWVIIVMVRKELLDSLFFDVKIENSIFLKEMCHLYIFNL